MRIEIRQTVFDPYAEIAVHERSARKPGQSGATACFIGTMRDFNDGSAVEAMTLEHYPGMTEKHLADICAQAAGRWSLHDVLVLHRVGDIAPGEAIVVVAVWSAHRNDAQEACRFIIEDLKSRAPFWKQEDIAGGKRWVSNNTSGYAAPGRKAGS
ncbi:MAG: molybdenum cofactor biosynthesis protein MoaE [Gammaproteobacteria bacterium]|nr:molybdenum cofactor biosynthesis protein MoaE [Gammaproteobacteria bacterium]